MAARRRASDETRTARFGVYLDPATRNGLLKAAIDAGVSATELVERLIEAHLRGLEKKKGRRRR